MTKTAMKFEQNYFRKILKIKQIIKGLDHFRVQISKFLIIQLIKNL